MIRCLSRPPFVPAVCLIFHSVEFMLRRGCGLSRVCALGRTRFDLALYFEPWPAECRLPSLEPSLGRLAPRVVVCTAVLLGMHVVRLRFTSAPVPYGAFVASCSWLSLLVLCLLS